MKSRKNSAFTLVEICVTLAIAVMAGAAIMTFYVHSLRSGYVSQQQIALLSTMRGITQEMLINASRAHQLILYNSAAAADRVDASSRLAWEEDESTINPTGNFAVFVTYEVPKPSGTSRHRIIQLVGYYTEKVDSGPEKLTRVIIDLSASPSTNSPEQILDANWTTGASGAVVTRKTFAPRIAPLALSDNYTPPGGAPQLFYRSSPENVVVCGQLFESATRTDTKNRNTLTRTFFFTVTTRA